MRNPRPVIRALGGLAVAAALVTAAPAQTVPSQSPDKPATDEGSSRPGDPQATQARPDDKDRKQGATSATSTSARSAAGASDGATKERPLRLRAFAVDTNSGASATATLDIVIERWSSDAERDRLRDVLQEKGGGDALRNAVQKIKPRAGFIRSASSVGWDIQFARETTMPDGTRRIVFGTDRPMSFWETANRPRSADYEFMVGEIRLDKNGKGDGRLVPAASVDYDADTRTIEVENYQNLPVNLTQVTVVGGKGSDVK